MKKNQKGFTFIELGICLTIMALISMVAIPKAANYFLNGKIQTLSEQIDEIRKGMVDCRAKFNAYTSCTWTRLTEEGYISSKTAAGSTTGNPWGGSYGVTPSGQSFQITAGGLQAEACQRTATAHSNMGNGVTGACAGSNLTVTFSN